MKARISFLIDGVAEPAIVGLDTCCTRTIVAMGFGQPVEGVRSRIETCGSVIESGPPAQFYLVKSNGDATGPFDATFGHNGLNGTIPRGCVALFSINLMRQLGVDLNWHSDYPGPDVPWVHIRPFMDSSHVSESKVRQYLEQQRH